MKKVIGKQPIRDNFWPNLETLGSIKKFRSNINWKVFKSRPKERKLKKENKLPLRQKKRPKQQNLKNIS